MDARRTNLIYWKKKTNSCVITDVAIPGDYRICDKKIKKIEKYQNSKRKRAEKALVAEKDGGCTSG